MLDLSLDLSRAPTLSEFYRYAIFTVFAVVIAQSFPQSTAIFIPYTKLLSVNGVENALTLILVYFFIVTSWIGYFRSITDKPHKETKLGTIRFGTDLLLIYLFYSLVSLVPDAKHHADIFVWAFPIIFVTFIFWDILKRLEYRKHKEDTIEDRTYRPVITGIAFVGFLIQSYFYSHVIPMKALTYEGNVVWNILFITISFIMIYIYRWRKWKDPKGLRKTKRPRKKKTIDKS